MPAIQPPACVLVTGANGFIGSWVVLRLLDAGFVVHAAVRSPKKAEEIVPLFSKKFEDGRLRFVIVPDISQPGAFDEAVKIVDAVVHTASPCSPEANATVNDPEYLNRPAIDGTIGVLMSVQNHRYQGESGVVVPLTTNAYEAIASALGEHNTRVRRVVITGSAVVFALPSDLLSIEAIENDTFNDYVVDLVDKKGHNAPFAMQYAASKTRSEKAVWEFVRSHGANMRFDVVMLLPPWVIGPELVKKTRISDLNTSNQRLLARFAQPGKFGDNPATWVDIRVTAQAHVNALMIPDVGNMRLAVSSLEMVTNQDYYNAYHEISPPPRLPFTVPPPQCVPSLLRHGQIFAEHLRLLHIEPTLLRDSLKDTIDYLVEAGLVGLSGVSHAVVAGDTTERAKL